MNAPNAYNLVDEPWIPVLMQDGTTRPVSLGDVFADASGAIADLALNPYERIAVFRLLLCIAQAALGPERLADESTWRAAKTVVGPSAAAYLEKWYDRFFLYGPHAFLQPDDVSVQTRARRNQSNATDDIPETGNSSVNKLCLKRASGRNSTLFDWEALNPNRDMSDMDRAINLIAFQSFSAGGRFSPCFWDGQLSPKNGSAFASPCRESNMLFSIIVGKDIIESIWLNLLTERTLKAAKIRRGRPVWECDRLLRSASDVLTLTYLGHLVPMSRCVKLFMNSRQVIMGEGMVYPTLNPDSKDPGKRPFGWREPMATIKANGKEPPGYVESSMERLPWRDLGSILSVRGNARQSSALALRHIENLPSEKEFVLWVGGLCSNQAKDIGTVEWFARLSVDLLEEPNMGKYEEAIRWANLYESALHRACKIYALSLKTPDLSKPLKKNRENELVNPISEPAKKLYWDLLAQPGPQRLVLDVAAPSYLAAWKAAARDAAEEAYRRACPAMTARQMEAYVQGLAKLHVRDDDNTPT